MEKKRIRTACAFCHTGCGMVIYKRGKEVERVTGDPDHPVGQGALCPKGMAVPEFLSAPNRVTAPLLRTPSGFKTISWDEALTFMAEKLEDLKTKYGPQNLVRFRGAPISDTIRDAFHQFLAVYGSSNTSGVSHLCSTPERMGFQSVFGERPDPDYEGTKLVVLWGANTEDSHRYGEGQLSRTLIPCESANKKGHGSLSLIHVEAKLQIQAHLWVPIRLGSDLCFSSRDGEGHCGRGSL